MGNLFNFDAPVWRAMGRIGDLMLLNILYVLSCLPIVTFGPATTALYYAAGRLRRDEGGVWRDYWSSFRMNFLQGLAIGLLYLLLGAGLFFGVWFYTHTTLTGANVLLVLNFVLLTVWAIAGAWVFVLQSRFYNPVGATLKNSLICGIAYLPRTVVMVLLNAVPMALLLFAPMTFMRAGVVFIAIYFAAAAYFNLRVIQKPMQKLLGEEEEPQEELEGE